jgi:hypothetical protein
LVSKRTILVNFYITSSGDGNITYLLKELLDVN